VSSRKPNSGPTKHSKNSRLPRNLLAAKAVALGASVITRPPSPSPMPPSKNAGDALHLARARAMCSSRARKIEPSFVSKGHGPRPHRLVCAMAHLARLLLLQKILPRPAACAKGLEFHPGQGSVWCKLVAASSNWDSPPWLKIPCARPNNSTALRTDPRAINQLSDLGFWSKLNRRFFPNDPKLNALLEAAAEHGASDLHIIAGVPPAFRITGEIILAE